MRVFSHAIPQWQAAEVILGGGFESLALAMARGS